MKIIPVTTASDYAAVGQLFAQYVAWLGIDLAFQSYAHELATLPYYGSARGALFLARVDDSPVSSVCVLSPLPLAKLSDSMWIPLSPGAASPVNWWAAS